MISLSMTPKNVIQDLQQHTGCFITLLNNCNTNKSYKNTGFHCTEVMCDRYEWAQIL